MGGKVRNGAVHYHLSEIFNIIEHRIEVHYIQNELGKYILRINDGRQIHPRNREYRIEVSDISEKDVYGREYQAHSEAEYQNAYHREEEQQRSPMHRHTLDKYYDNYRNRREKHIHKGEQALLKREYVFRNINLFYKRSRTQNRRKRRTCSLGHKVKYERARKVINYEIFNLEFEQI